MLALLELDFPKCWLNGTKPHDQGDFLGKSIVNPSVGCIPGKFHTAHKPMDLFTKIQDLIYNGMWEV